MPNVRHQTSVIRHQTKRKIFFLIFSILLLLVPITYNLKPALAESAAEIVTMYQMADEKAEDGDIMVSSDKGLERATQSFSPRLFGVLQNKPQVLYRPADGGGQPVARTGIAEVNTTTLNGTIKVGDFITSSAIPGKGQKATVSGNVIGVALTPLDENNSQQIDYTDPNNPKNNKKITSGKVRVAVRIQYAELTSSRQFSMLLGPLSSAFSANIQDPDRFTIVIRFMAAGLIVMIGFLVSFFGFSRSIPKAIEAIGRNPLAKNSIYISIGINIFFALVTTLIAIAAAFVVVKI